MDKNRLMWASRRGMLELDILLRNFVEYRYDTLAAEQQEIYQRFLACEDQDLFGWLLGHREPDDSDFAAIVGLIRDSARAGN